MCNPCAADLAQTKYVNVADQLVRGKQKSLTSALRAIGSGAAATTCAGKKSLKEFRDQKPTFATRRAADFPQSKQLKQPAKSARNCDPIAGRPGLGQLVACHGWRTLTRSASEGSSSSHANKKTPLPVKLAAASLIV
jgi:hypothetical protein